MMRITGRQGMGDNRHREKNGAAVRAAAAVGRVCPRNLLLLPYSLLAQRVLGRAQRRFVLLGERRSLSPGVSSFLFVLDRGGGETYLGREYCAVLYCTDL